MADIKPYASIPMRLDVREILWLAQSHPCASDPVFGGLLAVVESLAFDQKVLAQVPHCGDMIDFYAESSNKIDDLEHELDRYVEDLSETQHDLEVALERNKALEHKLDESEYAQTHEAIVTGLTARIGELTAKFKDERAHHQGECSSYRGQISQLKREITELREDLERERNRHQAWETLAIDNFYKGA